MKKLTKEETYPRIKRWQEADSVEERRGALYGLRFINKRHADAVVEALVEALSDEHQTIRLEAAGVLRELGKASVAAVATLAKTLNDENAHVRMAAAKALGAFGEDASVVVPQLVAALRDQNDDVKAEAASALASIGKNATVGLAELSLALASSSSDTHRKVAKAHATLSAVAEPVLVCGEPIALVGDNTENLIAKLGLIAAGCSVAVGTKARVIELMTYQDPKVRSQAAAAAGRLCRHTRSSSPLSWSRPWTF